MAPDMQHRAVANGYNAQVNLPRRTPNIGRRLTFNLDDNTPSHQSSSLTTPQPLRPNENTPAFQQQPFINSFSVGRPKTAITPNGRTPSDLSIVHVNNGVTNGIKQDDGLNGQSKDPASKALVRTKSDFGPRSQSPAVGKSGVEKTGSEDDGWNMRHGWEDEYASGEYLQLLHSSFYMYFTDKRHETGGNPKTITESDQFQEWRMKDRLKTVSAALVICLNIGVDPPDVVKPNPCAKLECWVDPTATTSGATKVMEQIGKKLQEQYETLSIRTRYKQYLDPSVDEMKKFCVSLRRNAKDERILFHYNGHGVPLPTQSGELWVFNKNYTQYIPISLHDVVGWLAGPSLYVLDCSHAGNILHNFPANVDRHERENQEVRKREPTAQLQSFSDCILLAACGRTETLPTNPELPSDLFTCCLTTPIDIALRYYLLENPLPAGITMEEFHVPGRLQDRRSPLGELNWIFTAITDTIAWNTLPRGLFKKLFRQDLMVAALFRNFLLSERIMRAHHCHPMSIPELPETHHHPLWQSWDLAIEMVISQLPNLLEGEAQRRPYEYMHSAFFSEQLTAFEVYLTQGATEHNIPSQLPIVLQVLLSQAHRLRALILLSKFLDLGPWAVNLALSIGIFPYVLKLLQSAAQELKPVMVFIWARILAVDQTCQNDLLKDSGYQYFISILSPMNVIPVGNASEHRAMCAFIIAMFCKDYHQGQVVCLSPELIEACLKHLLDLDNPLLRQWSCLCISMLWVNHPEAKWVGIRCLAHQRLCELVLDPVPEVRAAMLHALTNFLGIPDVTDQVAQIEESIASSVLIMTTDGSPMVRKELSVFFSAFIKRYENKFLVVAYEQFLEERDNYLHPPVDAMGATDHSIFSPSRSSPPRERSSLNDLVSRNTVFASLWKQLLILSVDPFPEVKRDAGIVVDYIHEALLQSPLSDLAQSAIDDIVRLSRKQNSSKGNITEAPEPPPSTNASPSKQHTESRPGYLSLGLKRTASVAASLRNLVSGNHASDRDSEPASSPRRLSQDITSNRFSTPPRPRAPAEWTRPPEALDHTTPSSSYRHADVPKSRNFKDRDMKETLIIPLESRFFEWSAEVNIIVHLKPNPKRIYTYFAPFDKYFREPQMKPNEPDEPGSADYNQRLWRRVRNERIIADNQPLKVAAGSNRWDNATGFMNNGSQPVKMCFHQFEDHLVTADDRDGVCVWDWQRQIRLSRFSAANPPTSRITGARFINEDDQALLMLGSSDGVIKLFRNYDSPSKVEIVSAWRALTDMVPSNKNAGLVFEWLQGQGKALVAGDVKVIKVWNAATEVCTLDIPARSGSCITSLTSDQLACNIFVAGFGDGAIRVFDQRMRPHQCMIRAWREHKQWITNVHMQRGGVRELVSGSRNGEVRLWDLRLAQPVRTFDVLKGRDGTDSQHTTLRTLSLHEHAPVFSAGLSTNTVSLYNTSGTLLSSTFPYSRSLLAHHYGRSHQQPILSTAFHPHRMMLAVGALGDLHVNLFSCNGLKGGVLDGTDGARALEGGGWDTVG
ncbi:MAG: hypothetical protein M1834_009383 [Cirrosporium novae-zelandiae]|nr:MAG: hypothetical protein M1834_009383 [Cirrosporium novae-zelandiae]